MSLFIFCLYIIVYKLIATALHVDNPVDDTAIIALSILAAAESIRMK
jgi:hypothetical protein